MFVAQENFQQATNGVASDSLYKLSLNGSEGKFDIKIADEYSGLMHLANYYAGMAYLNTWYNEAIDYLNKFKSDDIVLSGLATGAIETLMQKTITGRSIEKLR
jgi:hypothetical protein